MGCKNEPSDCLVLFVNGKKVVVENPDPEWTLLYFIRKKLLLTGSKLGCGEGGCGACTVMVSKYDRHTQHISHMSVNACLTPICSVHGTAITTVEGIGSTRTALHPVQERLARSHGSQCGFCTPGIVMSMYALLRNSHKPNMGQVETTLQGNLCRCTGYRPILDAFRGFTCCQDRGGNKAGCCRVDNSGSHDNGVAAESTTQAGGCRDKTARGMQPQKWANGNQTDGDSRQVSAIQVPLTDSGEKFKPYDPSQEPIFPPELMTRAAEFESSVCFRGVRVSWFRPQTLKELLDLKTEHPHAKLVNGNTEIGIEVKFKQQHYPVLVCPALVPELCEVNWTDTDLTVGAAVTMTQLTQVLTDAVSTLPEHQTRIFAAILEMLHWFAGVQIRNTASIGGNIMTGSPISDLVPLLSACDSQLLLASSDGSSRRLAIRRFYTGYRRNAAHQHEVLLSVSIPLSKQYEYFSGFKQSHRREDDIAIVNAGMQLQLVPGSCTVQSLSVCYGGMAATAVHATQLQEHAIGRVWDDSLLEAAPSLLLSDLPLSDSAPGGMVQYRRTLSISLFHMFYRRVADWIANNFTEPPRESFEHPEVSHSQLYQLVSRDQPAWDLVGRPVAHVSAVKQCTGEALYCDDIPAQDGELYAGLVLSSRAHADIMSVDPTAALQLDDVSHFYSATDLTPDTNSTGVSAACLDEQVFRSDTVTSMGQLIGVVLARDQSTAQRAARLVHVQYRDRQPCLLTIEDAIQHDSFFSADHTFAYGDVDATLESSDHVVEGEFRMGGQEHFYLETMACVIVPGEDGGVDVTASTQGLSSTQMCIARALDVPASRVVCRTKRLGGGFGGKETRTHWLTTAVAVAASRSGRAVRIMLDRDEDMSCTGTRHPFLGRYRAGVTGDGQLTAVSIQLFSNGGFSLDLSSGVMSRATTHCDNAYRLPCYRIVGRVCRTNTPSNTAFRGFGGPQGCAVAEAMMLDISQQLNLDPVQVRGVNLYREGDPTITRQLLNNCTQRQCWTECLQRSQYQQRLQLVEKFNSENRYKKRGLSILPNKYGIAFGLGFLNQGGALVHLYRDGSVLVTTGGVEMGQGLHTKCYQIVTRVLGAALDNIYINETSTDKVPNTSPTAASMSTDLYGQAVQSACEKLWSRLEPFRRADPSGSLQSWVSDAYMARVPLSVCGFHAPGGLSFDRSTGTGDMYSYHVYGATCAEVEVNCLTGDHKVVRVDIVMDIGRSINPAIDIGQIEGAFMQGYGLFCMERVKYSPQGYNYTRGPGAYKIPGFGDIPGELNVALLPGTCNPRAVYSSKAVGEPPLFSAAAVLHALQHAVNSYSEQRQLTDTTDRAWPKLECPATPDRVRMACRDWITEQVPAPGKTGAFKPWMVDL